MKIGIDFGTSFSLPAIYYLGTQKMLLPAGKYGIPSVFYYDSWDGVVIGEEAEDLGQGENAINLRREIKLDLNSSYCQWSYIYCERNRGLYSQVCKRYCIEYCLRKSN